MTPQIQEAFDKKYEEIGEDVWHDIGNDRIFYFGWKACEAVSERILEQQLDVAREFCRQYQIEVAQLKAQSDTDNETNLQLNLKNMELQAENKKLGDYYMKINSMYWNDEIFEVNHGEGFYTDEFVKMIDNL